MSSQHDAERADIERERHELNAHPEAELKELAILYMNRGFDHQLALKVAEQLSAHDRLDAHLRDELTIDRASRAQPLQAALTSALSFACFGLVPIAAVLIAPLPWRVPFVGGLSLLSLAVLGALGGYLGGASATRAALRVIVGGAVAMAVTATIGRIIGISPS